MKSQKDAGERAALDTVRTMLLWIVFVGIVGTGVELLLLGHVEDDAGGFVEVDAQQAPLVLLAVGLVVAVWYAAAPGLAAVRLFQFVMVLFVAGGLVGIGYHYAGNELLAREARPAIDGSALFRESLRGTSPVLAPGSMVLLGFVGLGCAHRHPCVAADGIGI